MPCGSCTWSWPSGSCWRPHWFCGRSPQRGVVPLPPMGTVPFAIGMALGVWELALVVAALGKVSARRQLRRHYRTPTDMAAFIGDDMVRMVDLTPTGAGLLSPRQLAGGGEVLLVTDLPMADGRPRSARLRLTVSTCRPDPGSAHDWRIGGALVPVTDEDRATLVEYCHVAAGAVPPHRERQDVGASGERGAPCASGGTPRRGCAAGAGGPGWAPEGVRLPCFRQLPGSSGRTFPPMSAAKGAWGGPATRAGASVPARKSPWTRNTTNEFRPERSAVFTVQREESPEVKSFPKKGLVKALGSFEPLPSATWPPRHGVRATPDPRSAGWTSRPGPRPRRLKWAGNTADNGNTRRAGGTSDTSR